MIRRTKAGIARSVVIAVVVASVAAATMGAVYVTGFGSDVVTVLSSRLFTGTLHGSAPPFDGPKSLEERIVSADVIALVRLLSMSTSVEEIDRQWEGDTVYVNALVFRFQVLEYLKGSGDDEVTGLVNGIEWFNTKLAARTMGRDLSKSHDESWDSNEAIVFLSKRMAVTSTVHGADRYELGKTGGPGFGPNYDYYSINSRRSKKWLPVINYEGAHGSGQSYGGERGILTGAEPEDVLEMLHGKSVDYDVAESGYNAALATSGQSPTIGLSYLRGLIVELEAEIAAGDGSAEYPECVHQKYEWIRHVRYMIAEHGGYRPETYHFAIASGLAAGTVFADGRYPFNPPANYNPADHEYPNPANGDGWIEGGDSALFNMLSNISIIGTSRPLPSGEYRFYYNDRWDVYIPCDAYPDELREDTEIVVNVMAPGDVLHEAFYDPVGLDGSVGAGNGSGEMSPKMFETDSGETVIERIEWRNGQVEMKTSPPADLSDHRLEFIALDGSVSLRLDFDDAIEIEKDGETALGWGVCEQPWQPGDLLMLRIAEGIPEDGVQATNDSDCP